MINEALMTAHSQTERPFGRVAVAIPISAQELEWSDAVLQILDQEPPFEELPEMFRRVAHATPDQPLGVLHSFSKKEDRPKVNFWMSKPQPGSDQEFLNAASLEVDVGALAALLAIAAPSTLHSGWGFPYLPVHDRTAPVDRSALTGELTGGMVNINRARIEVLDYTLPLDEGIGRWVYATPP